jgi:hypothetical protein
MILHFRRPPWAGWGAGAATSNNTFWLCSTQYDGATVKVRKNGTQVSSNSVTGNIAASTGKFSVGGYDASFGGNSYIKGDMPELLIYSVGHTPTEAATVEQYLNDRYAIY